MPAKSPEEICCLFQQYMAEGDVDSILSSIHDPEVVFLNQSGELKKKEGMREELVPFAAQKAKYDFNIKQIIESGDIALMHIEWKMSLPQRVMSGYGIEVARRQPDGTWRWLIGDPFTIGRQAAS